MPTPKKILLVTRPIAPPWDEASKNFAYALASDLRSNTDLELHLMTNGFVSQLPTEVIQEQIYTQSQNDFSFSQKIRLFWFLLWSSHKFDIIHLLFTPTKINIFFIKLVLAFSKVKTVQTVATLREDIFSPEEIKKLMFADIIVTYSDYAKNKLLTLGIENSQCIYPGINLEEYCKKEKNPELLAQYNFTATDFIINFSGEYTRLGAMDDVIDSFIETSAKIPNVKLSLAVRVKNERDAKKKKEVVEKLQKNDLLAKVAFHDDGKYNMTDIYNLADISIFPVQNMHGKFDIPLVVVEAMACEKAVIVSNLPILREFTSEITAVTITKGNVPELTVAIIDLYENPEKRNSLGKNGRKFCEEHFDIKKVSAKYERLYKNL
jgi:phosphatidylinositol alpha-1,6-mannosyltransferase